MELSGRVRILEDAGFGVWKVDATPKDLQFLGKPLARVSGRSVLGLQSYELSEEGEFIVFPIDAVNVLALGDSADCVAVAINRKATPAERKGEGKEVSPVVYTPANASVEQQKFRSGDTAFIAACEAERLPSRIVELGRVFLSRVRNFSNDRLHEGKHRKWVTYPRNFLALTIQNRNKQFCVHVKKTSVLSSLNGTLDIRDDRPGYVRFWLRDETQLEAAVKAARGSYGV